MEHDEVLEYLKLDLKFPTVCDEPVAGVAEAAIKAIETVDAVNAYIGGLGPQGAAPDVILRKVLELVSA